MRSLALAGVVLALLGAGFGCEDSESGGSEQALDLVLRSSAVDAGRTAGVDLEQLVRRGAADVFERLPTRPEAIRIEVKVAPQHALMIPEQGVGGGADTDYVLIVLDRPLRPDVGTRLPALLAHELHHVARFRERRVPAPSSLAEALVTEGLADHFAEDIFPKVARPWTVALTQEQEAAAWREAKPILHARGGYDHVSWFRGGPARPRWTGYTLGYRMVGAYLADTKSASEELDVDPRDVVAAYDRAREG